MIKINEKTLEPVQTDKKDFCPELKIHVFI
jgi:hypothetical protein